MLATAPDPFALAADLLDPPPDSDMETAIACSTSLARFAREAWPIVEPATPFVHGWHVDVICEHLEAVSAGELRRLIINIPPRAMKSLTCCVFWPAWEWLTKAHLRWLFASYASDLSLRDSVKCRRLIQSRGGAEVGTIFQRRGYQGVLSLLSAGDPWSLTGDQNAKEKYENTATGFRLATSVDGVATGEGGDRIVVDDPVNAKEARSDASRNDANRWWDETMTSRFNNDAAAAVIVMQRLHEEDLTGHLVAQESGWHHLCLPAEYEPAHPFVYPAKVKLPDRKLERENGKSVTVKGRVLSGDPRTEEGELLEPVRLSYRRLAELLKGMGSYGYAGQLQQRPSPAEGGMFKRHWWKRWKTLPPQWQRVICSWDMRFSDSQKAASSYVVGQVWGQDGADRYLLAQIRARLSFTDSVKAVKALSAYAPLAKAKLVEDKANGPAVIDSLQHSIPGLIPVKPEGGKDVRAAACEPTVEAGNVYLPPTEYIPCPAGYEATTVEAFIDECAVFPNGAHDDQVDSFSQALNWLEHKLATVTTESYMGSHTEPKVQRGDLTLKGERYIDKK